MVLARVVSLEGAHALVRVEEGCGRCHEAGGCGGVSLTRFFCHSARVCLARNACAAQPGDRVRVVMPARALARLATLTYGLPLAGLLLGALAGETFIGGKGALAGGLAGLLLAWGALFFLARRIGNPGDEPYIHSIHSS